MQGANSRNYVLMIIITRNTQRANDLILMLEKIQQQSVAIPLFEITTNSNPAVKLDFDIYVFISVNSADYFIQQHGILSEKVSIAVGPATAKALKTWSTTTPSEFNSKGIVSLLNTYKLKKRVCIVCGAPYNDKISFLTHHDITYYPIYKRLPAAKENLALLEKTLNDTNITAITFSSMYSLKNFHEFLIKNNYTNMINYSWVVVNKKMFNLIKHWGYTNNIYISKNATNIEIYNTLEHQVLKNL